MGSSHEADLWVYCGQFGRPHGVHGAVRLWPHNPQTELLKPGNKVYVSRQRSEEESRGEFIKLPASTVDVYTIRKARRDAKGWVVAFEEISTREQAERVKLCDWLTRRQDFPEPAEDEFYFSDLIGAEGILDDGRSLGILLEVLEAGAGEIFVFEGLGEGEVLVPFVWESFILKIDLENHQVHIRTVKGLLEGGI